MQVAFEQIYHRGFHAVGVRDIAENANVTVGAFFHHFPTKNDVGYAIVEEVIRPGILERWITPLSAHKNPLQGILKCFKKTFDTWPDQLVTLGCPLNNLTQELSAVDPSFKERTQSVLTDWMDATEKHLKRAKISGYLTEDANPREMAVFIVTMQEGTFAMGKALNDRKVFSTLYNSFRSYIEAHAAKESSK